MISEQSLDGWDNKPVKFSNVKYPQTKDNDAPQNFFLLSSAAVVVLEKHIY